jgi:hypothetical protein
VHVVASETKAAVLGTSDASQSTVRVVVIASDDGLRTIRDFAYAAEMVACEIARSTIVLLAILKEPVNLPYR